MPNQPTTPTREEIRDRADAARAGLASCRACERRCGVDRRAGAAAPCGLGEDTWCFKRHVSLAEEVDLLPSYMVYLGACNFRCRFCVQGPACFEPRRGSPVDPAEAAADFEGAVNAGARTINLLGGEPSMHVHTILDIAARATRPLPLVLNSNMYMTPEVLDLLDGVVVTYLADFKFGNDACARRLADVEPYVEIVTRNLRLAAERAEVYVRRLLMPGHLECCLRPVAEWTAANLPGVRFSLMTGYVPAGRTESTAHHAELRRCLTAAERAEAAELVTRLGLRGSGGPRRTQAAKIEGTLHPDVAVRT